MARKTRGKHAVSIANLERQALEHGKECGRMALETTLQRWIDTADWPRRLDPEEEDGGYILKEWRRLQIKTVLGKIAMRAPYYWKSGADPLPVIQSVFGLSARPSVSM